MMRTIGKKIVAVLIPSGVTAALMLGPIGTANAAENDHKTTPANIMAPCVAPGNLASIAGVDTTAGVQGGPAPSGAQDQQCGDDPLSHIGGDIPVQSDDPSPPTGVPRS